VILSGLEKDACIVGKVGVQCTYRSDLNGSDGCKHQESDMFKVHARKIHVFREWNTTDLGTKEFCPWVYVWSTNAHKTCKDALAAAKALTPNVKFKASFEKN